MWGGRIAAVVIATTLIAWPAPAAEFQVKAKDLYFTSSLRVITVGDTVTWLNDGDVSHTVTTFPGAPESFDSSPDDDICDDGNPLTEENCLDPGDTFEFTFTKAGIYDYRCKPHGTTDAKPTASGDQNEPCGMCGRIDVRPAARPTEPEATPTLERTRTPDPSESASPSASPTTSASETPSGVPSDEPTDGSVPLAAPGGDGGGRALVALLAIAALSGVGFFTWRRFLATR